MTFLVDLHTIDNTAQVKFSTAALAEPVVRTALASWDPMKDDFSSMKNSYGIDLNDAGQAMVGYG